LEGATAEQAYDSDPEDVLRKLLGVEPPEEALTQEDSD
jgi:hypothetical protein